MNLNLRKKKRSQISIFEIRIKDQIDAEWADWFEGLTLTLEEDGNTLISGPVVDQSALYASLKRVHQLGLELISVNQIGSETNEIIEGETNMSEKSIIIIGAGISGLSAGCYGQMNDYKTQIFEMHEKAGGLCTGWERRGYTIGTIGWVNGSGPANNDFHNFWKELGVLQKRTFIDYEEYVKVEGKDGQVFTLYTDINRLEQEMLDLAPEDKPLISGFIKALWVFTRFNPVPLTKPGELWGFMDKVKFFAGLLPNMGALGKWMKMSVRDFADQFKNPFMREAWSEAIPNVLFFDPNIAMSFVLSTFAGMHLKNAGYPVGGAPELVKTMEKRYRNLGGELHFESKVAKILVENDKAVGIRLENGTEYRSNFVVSASDGYTTIFKMLEGKYVNEEVTALYESTPLTPPLMLISLGVNRTFKGHPPSIGGDVFPLNKPIQMEGRACNWLGSHVYNFDPTLAPEGKSRIRVMLQSDYGYWKDLWENDGRRYKAEQEEIADQVIAALEKRYPGIIDQVEMCDVATPVSFERYTGNWKGSYLGWLASPEFMDKRISKTLPGLENFYLVGTWSGNGSLGFAATSGRHVTQIICHKDQKPFITSVP